MTPLRNNLEQAKASYEQAHYPGDLARDVLGAAVPIAPAGGSRFGLGRGAAALAIAAALAVGLSVGIFAGRSSMKSDANTTVAIKNTSTSPHPTTSPVEAVTPVETRPQRAVESPTQVATNTTPAAEVAFTVVPSAADESVSIVPNLMSLADASSSSSASIAAPMSLMMLSADEYAEQQTVSDSSSTIDEKAIKSSQPNRSNGPAAAPANPGQRSLTSPAFSEERT